MPMVAWYMLSNESYMNRVISDVFPTGIVERSLASLAGGTPELPVERTALLAQENQPRRQVSTMPTEPCVIFLRQAVARWRRNFLLEFLQRVVVRPASARGSHGFVCGGVSVAVGFRRGQKAAECNRSRDLCGRGRERAMAMCWLGKRANFPARGTCKEEGR